MTMCGESVGFSGGCSFWLDLVWVLVVRWLYPAGAISAGDSTITWRNKKEEEMIKHLNCFWQGSIGARTLEEIKEYMRDMVRAEIVGFDKDASGVREDCYYGWLNINLFDKRQVGLNPKNIEYYEKFSLVADFGNDDKLNSALHKYRIEDVGIELYVYRIGSYSYYVAICQAYSPNHPQDD